MAFVPANEADVKPEFATELTRARRLVSSEFVDKMKEKFKESALKRIQAEKEVGLSSDSMGQKFNVCFSPPTPPSRKRIAQYVSMS